MVTASLNSNNHLSVSYENTKLSLSLNEKKFPLEHIWINKQPAEFLKNLSKIEAKDITHYIVKGEEIFVTLPSQKKIAIYIILCKHIKKKFSLSPNLQVDGLKEIIKKKYALTNYKIFNSETELADYYSTLGDNKIIDGATLKLEKIDKEKNEIFKANLNQSQSSEHSIRPISFVNFKNGRYAIPIGEKAGMNFTGFCSNCGKPAIIKKGFGKFDIKKCVIEIPNCVPCEAPFVISTCSLLNCEYSIKGSEKINNKIHDHPEYSTKVSKLGKVLIFDSSTSNTSQWVKLEITVKQLSRLEREFTMGFSYGQAVGLLGILTFIGGIFYLSKE